MGDTPRANAFRMGQLFNSHSDSPDSLALSEVYCAGGDREKLFMNLRFQVSTFKPSALLLMV
jgi:hypothetical protein